MDTIEDVRRICKKIGSGIEADQWEADYLKDFVGESVTDEERAYFRQWYVLKNEEAKQRLGDSPFAYYIIQHAWRYYRVITLKAPDIIVMNEARGLAAALSLFRWCKKYEYVDNAIRSHYDRLELMCYSDAHEKVVNYRVDRMKEVTVLDTPVCDAAQIPEKQIAAYTGQTFKMFGGEPETVTLQFGNNLIGVVYDKFGENTKMVRVDEGTCSARVMVQISPTFWGWLFQFASEMRIVEPEYLIERYKKLLDAACE